jgi:hypothetical protein
MRVATLTGERRDPSCSKYRYMNLHTRLPYRHATVGVRQSLGLVYLSVISVNTTLSNVLDVEVDGAGAGSDLPVVGISPAKIEVERAHKSAIVIANRFMGFKAPSGV